MSVKGTITTASYLKWNQALFLIQSLKADKKYTLSFYVAISIYSGLRISDILKLRWIDLLDQSEIKLVEQKTNKARTITIHRELETITKEMYRNFGYPNKNNFVFLNRTNTKVISVQYFNRAFKKMIHLYKLDIDTISSHTFRKTFGRRIWTNDNYSDRAILYLTKIFNHSSLRSTRSYLGIDSEEIADIYLSL